MSKNTPPSNEREVKATVIQVPPLGQPVLLGELYDQRSGKFLGVQLYPEEEMQVTETDVRHTDLSLSLSTTHIEKSSMLEIDIGISLNILGGLIKISGSATYVQDVKSNTVEQAYAMALKMRLKERRILFGEDRMGRNVLDVTVDDYIRNGVATHFVSSIVYGGTIIINLVARQAKMTSTEKVEGSLKFLLEGLKGAVRLQGNLSEEIKNSFKGLNDKFDLVVHSDVVLDRLPTNPPDVLDTFASAASLIRKGGGVPILVTLQPLSEKLGTTGKIYEIDAILVDQVQKAFALLDDIHSRFAVLSDSVKGFSEFVPEMARVVHQVSLKFNGEHEPLLREMRKFLEDYRHGKPIPPRYEGPKKDDGTYDLPALKDVIDLYEYHLELDDPHPASSYYPSTLVGLENEFRKFRDFVLDIQQLREVVLALDANCKQFVDLRSTDDVKQAVNVQHVIPLFVVTSFTTKQPRQPTADKLEPYLAMARFVYILRQNISYFNDPSAPPHIFYAETREMLERGVTKLGKYAELENPFFVIGEVLPGGQLSWSDPLPRVQTALTVEHDPAKRTRDLSYVVQGVDVDGTKSFSVQVWGKPSSSSSEEESTICLLRTRSGRDFLKFQMRPFGVQITRSWGELQLESDIEPPSNATFVATFVQDLVGPEGPSWKFYLGKQKVAGPVLFTGSSELLPESANMQVAYPIEGVTWWNGKMSEVRLFSVGLSEEDIAAEVEKPSGTV